jgi:hypothetical protein
MQSVPVRQLPGFMGIRWERVARKTLVLYDMRVRARTTNQMTATLIQTEDATEAEPAYELPISSEEKTTILLNVEGAVKDLAAALAKKREIKGVDIDPTEFAHLPHSLTGVMVHYFCKGLKDDFDITFAEPPVSLKQRGGSAVDKKIAGKKRLLTREQKNELVAKTQMSFYEKDIAAGTMTVEQAMFALKDAYERKAKFEEMGYLLPPKKTEYPYWIDEAVD